MRQDFRSLQRKNEKVKRTTMKLMEQIRKLKRKLVEAKAARFASEGDGEAGGGAGSSDASGKHLSEIQKQMGDMAVASQIKHMEEDLFGIKADHDKARDDKRALSRERTGAHQGPNHDAQQILVDLLESGPKLERDRQSLQSRRAARAEPGRRGRRVSLVDAMITVIKDESEHLDAQADLDALDDHGVLAKDANLSRPSTRSVKSRPTTGAMPDALSAAGFSGAKEAMMMKLLRDLEDMLEICIEMSLCEDMDQVMGLMESHIKTLVSADRCTVSIERITSSKKMLRITCMHAPLTKPLRPSASHNTRCRSIIRTIATAVHD